MSLFKILFLNTSLLRKLVLLGVFTYHGTLLSLIVISGWFWVLIRHATTSRTSLSRYLLYANGVGFWIADVIGNYTLFALQAGEWNWKYRGDIPWTKQRTITERLRYYKNKLNVLEQVVVERQYDEGFIYNEDHRKYLLALWWCDSVINKIESSAKGAPSVHC